VPLSTLTNRRGSSNFPLTLGPLAWYYAHERYLVFAEPGLIAQWIDRTGNGNTLGSLASNRPAWSPNGWRTGVGAVDFDGVTQFLSTTSGGMLAYMTGADIPFSVLMTARIDASNDHGICYWLDGGNARSHIRTNNAPPETLRYVRTDDAATSVTVTGTLDMGTSNNRFGVAFPGTTVSTWRGRDLDNNATACNVGTCTFSTFELGRTSVGQMDGVITEFIVLPRTFTAAEWERYVYYSIGEFG